MKSYKRNNSSRKRKKRELIIIGISLVLVAILTFIEANFWGLRLNLPIASNIALFALININVILLILAVYLVLRNVAKLVYERKKNILGHKLKTKLIAGLIGLTIIPTFLLFSIAVQFISNSMDYWFNLQVEQSLEKALDVGKRYYDDASSSLLYASQNISEDVTKMLKRPSSRTLKQMKKLFTQYLAPSHLDGVYLLKGKKIVARAEYSEIDPKRIIRLYEKKVVKNAHSTKNATPTTTIYSFKNKELVFAFVPLEPKQKKRGAGGAHYCLVTMRKIPTTMSNTLYDISKGYENYQQLKMLQSPFKVSHFIIFSIITLLILFAAIWFGFFLAKSITIPIRELAEATNSIAQGDLNVYIEPDRDDEIGMLITSFNRMAQDLKNSKTELEETNRKLQEQNEELEKQRRYIETVLSNVAAGVVSVDAFGNIRTINKAAETMFGVRASEVVGQHYSNFLHDHHQEIVKEFARTFRLTRQRNIQKEVKVILGANPKTLLVNVTFLSGDENEFLGIVVVLDDLTYLEKAKRMAAWREVARRIAHEVKNPLTPIGLSAQRLRRRYLDRFREDGHIFDECTRTIVEQVEEMKRLVNEFSQFARLPSATLAPTRIQDIIADLITFYRNNYPDITFKFEELNPTPTLDLDANQINRALINILDNSVAAIKGTGEVSIRLSFDNILKIARLEIADTGCGIPLEDKPNVFEPYFSTKEKGMGLGLAIVKTIIADHNGFIRIKDNVPAGTVVVIELPGKIEEYNRVGKNGYVTV